MINLLNTVPNALANRHGMPRPDWSVIYNWVESNVAVPDLDQTWTQLASEWVDVLIAVLPKGYSRSESPHFMLLSNGDSLLAERILRSCEESRRIILSTLPGVAREVGYGKYVVFTFGAIEEYYDYINDFYPNEGEFALSVGTFLDVGYGHLVMCMAYRGEHNRTIAHELNHALLRHLPLPLWLNEGVTQVVEDTIVGSSYFTVDHKTARRHRAYWDANSIHSFWTGESFSSPDEGQELSYHLSQVLFRNLAADYPHLIPAFLNSANYSDAGNSALIELCGRSLSDRVSQFLGEGDWSPRNDYFDDEM